MSDYIDRQVAFDALGVTKNATKYGGDHSGYDTRMLYEYMTRLLAFPPQMLLPWYGVRIVCFSPQKNRVADRKG